jgi:hypothetical protein
MQAFRRVSKWFLARYVAVFQWGYNVKEVTDELVRVLLGILPSTCFPSWAELFWLECGVRSRLAATDGWRKACTE